MKTLFVLMLLLTACGKIVIEHKGSVDINFNVDGIQMKDYFTTKCEQELMNPTPEELDTCVNDKLKDLLATLGIEV